MEHIDYEENLLLKIRNGDELTNDDYVAISFHDNLIVELFISVGKNLRSCDKNMCDVAFCNIFGLIDDNLKNNPYFSNSCLKYFKYLVDQGYYSEGVYEYLESLDVNKETVDELREYIESKLTDESFSFNNSDYDQETISSLLDHKRYKDIEKIRINYNINSYITKELYEKFLREWPYEKKPWIIEKYEIQNELYNYSTKDNVIFLLNCFEDNKKSREKILKVIIDKLYESPSLNELTGNIFLSKLISDTVFGYGKDSLESRKEEFKKLLFDKNCLMYANQLLDSNIITKEEYESKYNYCLDNNLILPDNVVLRHITPENDKLIRNVIEHGNLDILFKSFDSGSVERNYKDEIVEKYEPYIIEQIKNNNPYYENKFYNLNYNLSKYPNILKAIIETGKVRNLKVQNLKNGNFTYDEIISWLEKYPNLFLDRGTINSEYNTLFLKRVFELRKYNLIESKELLNKHFVDEYLDIILEHLDNIKFASIIVKQYFYFACSNPQIMNKLLSNSILVDKVIEKIIHNETLTSYLNNDTYNIVKDYYVKKYTLNKDNLERLEKVLGPKIIRYFTNFSLKKIINLDEETFNKVLGLFPEQEYTMKDFEAGFESLIQYLYGNKNPDDITIFPNLIHAINDNNIDIIKQLKEKIILYTKLDFTKSICEKYGLNNINNTNELLDLIIQKYNTEEREKYLTILHEITNEFILTSRENFRNNHLFEAKYSMYKDLIENIIESIDKNDEKKLQEYINLVADNLDSKFFDNFNINEINDGKSLLYFLIEKIRNEETRNDYLLVLKEVVDYSYQKEKNKHLKELVLGEELSLPYVFDEKSLHNEVLRYIVGRCYSYYGDNNHPVLYEVINILKDQGIDGSLVSDCINYYSGTKKCTNDLSLVQQTMPLVIRTANDYVLNHEIYETTSGIKIDIDEIVNNLNEKFKIKKIYNFDNTNDPYPILLNLNIGLLKEGLFKDEELYQKLVDFMNKKKLHLLPDNLKEMLDECGISSDYSDIASFINFFGPILDSERKKLEASGKDPEQALSGLASILINADTYSSISSVYAQILGEKDSKLIKSNPKPNSAIQKIENNQRLKEAIQLTMQNFQRQDITVPTFDTNVKFISEETDEEKELNVIVGNFTDSSNLTHGERTGACMRIGGVGESLFNFCLTNPNGFHIRFEDPKTHEYISRVSGFRNGNTVFLNELRFSCDKEKYSNKDVISACKMASDLLIEYSKDSECPIENVVIAKEYAMAESPLNETFLGIKNNKEGLPAFYSDIGNSGIVLATTAKEEKFAPINFDKSKVPTYKPCRSKPLILTSEKELMGKINRVASVKTVLSGVNYEDIGRIEFEDGLLCGIVSDDWYIYVDKNKNINYDIIEIDERAKAELQQYLEIIDDIIKQTEKENKEMESDVYGL